MAAGESGLGKSTLLKSLFSTHHLGQDTTAGESTKPTFQVTTKTLEVEEEGILREITLVDTPGLGDAVDSSGCSKPLVEFIDRQFERYLDSSRTGRDWSDSRVHCLLFFISPYGRGLKPLDLEVMKDLSTRVNIIPLIAKADSLTKTEMENLKVRISEELRVAEIQIYQPPDSMEARLFNVCGANALVEVVGKIVRARHYPWGTVEVENPDHCDFAIFRKMLISHMENMVQVTHNLHYQGFVRNAALMPFQRVAQAMMKRRESEESNFNNNFL